MTSPFGANAAAVISGFSTVTRPERRYTLRCSWITSPRTRRAVERSGRHADEPAPKPRQVRVAGKLSFELLREGRRPTAVALARSDLDPQEPCLSVQHAELPDRIVLLE